MRIGYLAPEIPALSATFVYNEILQLQYQGVKVEAISVHRPAIAAQEPAVKLLSKSVFHLYDTSFVCAFSYALKLFLLHPVCFFTSLKRLANDVFQVGIFSRDAAGLVYRFVFATRLSDYLRRKQITHLHVHFAHVPTDIACMLRQWQELVLVLQRTRMIYLNVAGC